MTPLLSNALLRAQSDERLCALAAGGHDRAFEAIVERYRRPLLRHVRRFLPDTRAEDVVQAAFVSAWGALRDGTEVRDLRPWLYRIATNGALNALKRAGADDAPLGAVTEASAVGGDPGIELERREAARRALAGLAGLPERQRDALVATALGGRSHSDVAAELGMTDGALRQLVHRARTQLRAVATAFTPPPLIAAAASQGELTAARVAEVAAGAGGAGLAAAGMKLGAVAATAGALVVSAPKVAEVAKSPADPPAAAAEVGPPQAASQRSADAAASSGDGFGARDEPTSGSGGDRGTARRGARRRDDSGERRNTQPGIGPSRTPRGTSGIARPVGGHDSGDDHAGEARDEDESHERRDRRGRSGGGDDDRAGEHASSDDGGRSKDEDEHEAVHPEAPDDDASEPGGSPKSGSSGSSGSDDSDHEEAPAPAPPPVEDDADQGPTDGVTTPSQSAVDDPS